MLDEFQLGTAKERLLDTVLATSINRNSSSNNIDEASDAELMKKKGNNSFMKGEYVEVVHFTLHELLVEGKIC